MAKSHDPLLIDPVLLERAAQLCKQRLQTDPDNRAVLRSLAEVYRKLGNLVEAGALYERLYQLDPQDQEAGYMHAVFGGNELPPGPAGVRAAPYVLLKDFLPQDFHDTFLAYLISVQKQFIPVLCGTQGEYKPDVRQTLEFRGPWQRRSFQQCLAEALPRVLPRLDVPPFKMGPFELVVRAYQDGNFFKMHRDAPPNSPYAARAINFVYYFHRQPRPYTGGELLLFDSDVEADKFMRARFTCVVPEDNSIIFFPPNYYHSVVPMRCPSKEFADSRFAINGHVHKRGESELGVDGSIENAAGAI